MTQNIKNLEALNQQMKDEIQELIDSGDHNNLLGFHSGPNFVPPRPFLTGGPQDNTRLTPIARCQGKSMGREFAKIMASIVAVKIDKTITGAKSPVDYELESKRRQNFIDPKSIEAFQQEAKAFVDSVNADFSKVDIPNMKELPDFNRSLKEHNGDKLAALNGYLNEKVFAMTIRKPDLGIIDDPIKEQSFKKTPHEFSAELIANYQKMIESIEGKEGAGFSQRKFWEGQYMQSPTLQSNSAFGFTDVVKIEVEQSAYDKLKEVAIAGHDRIKWHDQFGVDVLAIDCVPVFVNDELTGEGICRVYTNEKTINLAFYPENIFPKRPMTIMFTDI